MAEKTEFLQAIDDAILDADSLEKFINGSDSETVLTRLSAEYPTLQKAIKQMFENGGLPATPFKTKSMMESSELPEGSYAQVVDSSSTANGLYRKESGVWVKSKYDPVVISTNYTDSKAAELKDSMLEPSDNLVNTQKITNNKIISPIGEVVEPSVPNSYALTEYIPVSPSKTYTLSSITNIASPFIYVSYYTLDKTFIRRDNIITDENRVLSITIPDNARYVRFNVSQITIYSSSAMFNLGSEPLPYVSGYPANKLTGVGVGDDIVSTLKTELIPYDFVANHVKSGLNLFSEESVMQNSVIDRYGVIKPPTTPYTYSISDYIAVDEGEVYTLSGESGRIAFINTAYYNKDKEFIARVDTAGDSSNIVNITIPNGAAYLRFNITGEDSKRMLAKGSTAHPYEPYKKNKTLEGVDLSQEVIDDLASELSIKKPNNYLFDVSIDGVFNTSIAPTQYVGFLNTKYTTVYSMYDALQAQHSNVISRHVLGNDGVGNEVAYYKFTPTTPDYDGDLDRPTVFLLCGLHGSEHVSPLATYLMLDQVYNNWQSDELLEALRFNVNFIVLPVANPSGWDAITRQNHNGVDLNRNFPVNWAFSASGSTTYGGASPASELETQYIMQVFDDNPNINVFYDFHNFSTSINPSDYLWISSSEANKNKMNGIGVALMQRMTRAWRSEYDWIPDGEWYAGYVSSTEAAKGGMAKLYANTNVGINIAATFETCDKWHLKSGAVPYDALHCKTMTEAVTNLMLVTLKSISK